MSTFFQIAPYDIKLENWFQSNIASLGTEALSSSLLQTILIATGRIFK